MKASDWIVPVLVILALLAAAAYDSRQNGYWGPPPAEGIR